MEVVEIVWIDAQSSLEPMTIEDAITRLKPQTSHSVGYLAHESKEYLLLVFVDFGSGIFKHWQVIPKGMIKKRKVIKK